MEKEGEVASRIQIMALRCGSVIILYRRHTASADHVMIGTQLNTATRHFVLGRDGFLKNLKSIIGHHEFNVFLLHKLTPASNMQSLLRRSQCHQSLHDLGYEAG